MGDEQELNFKDELEHSISLNMHTTNSKMILWEKTEAVMLTEA